MKNKEAQNAFYSIKENKSVDEIIKNLELFNQYLIELFNHNFSRRPKGRDVYQTIFIQANQLKDHRPFVKNNLIAAQWTIERLINNLKKDLNLNESLSKLIKDVICELQPVIKYYDPEQDYSWLLTNTNTHISNFYHSLSYSIFWTGYPANSNDAVVLSSSSPFLIRQSIEYKIKRILGVYRLLINGVDDARIMKKCFRAIERNKKFYITKNFDFDIVKLIYSWTNFHIHAGTRPFPWITENAIDYLSSLFHVHKDKSSKSVVFSLYGGVEVAYNDLEVIKKNTENTFKELIKEDFEIKWHSNQEVMAVK